MLLKDIDEYICKNNIKIQQDVWIDSDAELWLLSEKESKIARADRVKIELESKLGHYLIYVDRSNPYNDSFAFWCKKHAFSYEFYKVTGDISCLHCDKPEDIAKNTAWLEKNRNRFEKILDNICFSALLGYITKNTYNFLIEDQHVIGM